MNIIGGYPLLQRKIAKKHEIIFNNEEYILFTDKAERILLFQINTKILYSLKLHEKNEMLKDINNIDALLNKFKETLKEKNDIKKVNREIKKKEFEEKKKKESIRMQLLIDKMNQNINIKYTDINGNIDTDKIVKDVVDYINEGENELEIQISVYFTRAIKYGYKYEWQNNDCPYDHSGELIKIGKLDINNYQILEDFLKEYTGESSPSYCSGYGLNFQTYEEEFIQIIEEHQFSRIKEFVINNNFISVETLEQIIKLDWYELLFENLITGNEIIENYRNVNVNNLYCDQKVVTIA